MLLKLVTHPITSVNGIGRLAVVNAETGDEVKWVRKVTVICDLSTEFIPVATIEVELDIDLDVYALFEAKKVVR